MKKTILSLSTILVITSSSNVFAGGVKNLLIDAEEAISENFYQQGLSVESVTNHQFTPVKNGIGLKADVETTNPKNMSGQSWTCIVSFEKTGANYSPKTVDCE